MPPRHLLLIDDSRTFSALARAMLEERGYELESASSAEDGLARARERRPLAILMDIHLPGMTGYEAVGTLRRDPLLESLPVIALTMTEPIDRRSISAGMQVGFDAFLPKPATQGGFDILLEVIVELARRPPQHDRRE